MKQSKIKDLEYNLIDREFDFKGLWGRNSRCGLKIVKKADKTIVIVTELYNDNPGSSVTEFCAELATIICKEFSINMDSVVYIQHIPEINSNLDFYEEAFDLLKFDRVGNSFTNPDWQPIERDQVLRMIRN